MFSLYKLEKIGGAGQTDRRTGCNA